MTKINTCALLADGISIEIVQFFERIQRENYEQRAHQLFYFASALQRFLLSILIFGLEKSMADFYHELCINRINNSSDGLYA